MEISIVALALMPISQAVSWYLILEHPLYASVWKIAAFYCVWALYNRFFVAPQELGQFSMGFLAVAAYLERKNVSIVGAIFVLLNFAVPAYYVLSWSPSKLARNVKKSDTQLAIIWAYIFKLYFISNFCLWSMVLHKIWNKDRAYTPV
jgi:hypothetical protein